MKRKYFIYAATFFITLFLFGVCVLFKKETTFSETENRSLAVKPEVSWEKIVSGTFQDDFTDFLSDQIPFRNEGIETKAFISKLIGKKEINDVYLGEDGYYFQKFTDESYSVSKMNSLFQMLEEFCNHQDVPVLVMFVPSSGTILKENLAKFAPYYDADVVFDNAKAYLGNNLIDIRDEMTDNASGKQLYYRTDHHWTAEGAYVAYQKFCDYNNLTIKDWDYFQMECVTEEFYGTLHGKVLDNSITPDSISVPINLPEYTVVYDEETVSDSVYDWDFLSKKDKYALFFGGNWGKVEIDTEIENGKHILIIKDSFANSFVPYILEDYEQITMIDLRYYQDSIEEVIDENEITEILFLYETSNFLTDTGILKLNN